MHSVATLFRHRRPRRLVAPDAAARRGGVPAPASTLRVTVALGMLGLGLSLATPLAAQQPDALPGAVTAASDEMRLVVNLPAYRLDVYRGEAIEHSYRVTIGKRGYETPTGAYQINHIIWNPWWHPPQSDWAKGRKPERPGPSNPMGRAKLHFAELLYLHGSSNTAALGRSGSHGCVRLSNADVLDLARRVQEYAAPDSGALVQPLIGNPSRTRRMGLERSVRLEIRYDLAEVRDGQLEVHPDVYGLSRPSATRAEMVYALLRAGIDLAAVDPDRLDRLAAATPRSRRQVPLSDLVAMTPPAPAAMTVAASLR